MNARKNRLSRFVGKHSGEYSLHVALVEHVRRVLFLCDQNISEAARRLGVSRRTLERWKDRRYI